MELNETERAVLYCWINDNGLIDTSGLREDDFSSKTLKCAYSASRSLRAQNEPVDMITLTERCESLDMALPPEGGWFQYFAVLVRDFYLAGRYAEYESRLIERRNRLQAAKAGERIQALALDAKRPYAEVHSDIMALADGIPGNDERQIKAASDIAVETYAHLNRVISGEKRPISTGLDMFDYLCGGLYDSELTILAARPAQGKSALAWFISEHIAQHRSVLFLSREMGALQLGMRMLSSQSGVSINKIRLGKPSEGELKVLVEGMRKASALKIDVDTTSKTPLQARSVLREKEYGLLVCDYMQIMQPDRSCNNREQEVSAISRGLKELAMEFDIPVLCLSQLSREIEKRGKKAVPRLSDLRESGAIEQDADNVMFLYHEDDTNSGSKILNLELVKQRQGDTGRIFLEFKPCAMRFRCLSKTEAQSYAS